MLFATGGLALLGLVALHGRRIPAAVRGPAAAAVAGAGGLALLLLTPGTAGGGGGGAIASRQWFVTDHLGSANAVLQLVDGSALVLREVVYEPFGAVAQEAGSDGADLDTFAGHRRQAETDLVYMRARWMDPASGTFLSVDPVLDLRSPQAHNAYRYAGNNPLNATDPTGMFTSEYVGNVEFEVIQVLGQGPGELLACWDYPCADAHSAYLDQKHPTESTHVGAAAHATGRSGTSQGSGTHDLMSPPIEGVERGMGPNTSEFMASSNNVDALAGAATKLGREAGEFPKFSTIGTAIVPGEGLTPASTATAETGMVRKPGVIGGITTAADVGASAVLIRLPYTMDNSAVSRGGYVGQALHVSRINGGLPVFLQAPRGSFGSLLAVEFTGTRMNPAGRIAPVRFR